MKPVVLILIGCFYPGHEATGPNLSIRTLCEGLADRFEFRLIARDRAPGDDRPIVAADGWHDLGFAKIHYLPIGKFGAKRLIKMLRSISYDLLVLNSFFCREFTGPTLMARRLGCIPATPILLSPRGEFSSGALAHHALAKGAYLRLAKQLGLLNRVTLHATSAEEGADIAAIFPNNQLVEITNPRTAFPLPPHQSRQSGSPLRAAFLARLVPTKGLDVALDILARTETPVDFTIYGPISDPGYWAKCQQLVQQLPPHIRVKHGGVLPNASVPAAMAAQDILLLPSRSENFGHAIFESLNAGTPVVIGDKTPWLGLAAAKAGFDLPTNDRAAFAAAITQIAAMPQTEINQWRSGARRYAEAFLARNQAIPQMGQLFTQLIAQRGNTAAAMMGQAA